MRGKGIAALVHLEDAEYLEELEDRIDLEELRQAKKEFEESGEKAIPLEEVAKELGLELKRK